MTIYVAPRLVNPRGYALLDAVLWQTKGQRICRDRACQMLAENKCPACGRSFCTWHLHQGKYAMPMCEDCRPEEREDQG